MHDHQEDADWGSYMYARYQTEEASAMSKRQAAKHRKTHDAWTPGKGEGISASQGDHKNKEMSIILSWV